MQKERWSMHRATKRWLLTTLAILFCLATVATAGLAASGQATQILYPMKDNTLIESPTGDLSNGAGPALFVGRTNQPRNSLRRGLVAFDVAGAIPAGAKIQSVVLTLTLERTHAKAERIELRRLRKDWGEGNSNHPGGRGAPATRSDATWLYTFFEQAVWSQPGGDFVRQASAVQAVDNRDRYRWGTTPRMVKDVKRWLKSPETNFGWLLIGNESVPKTAKRFASRENGDELAQPQLAVTYTLPRR